MCNFDGAADLTLCKEFGGNIAGIVVLAHRIDERRALQAVALDPYGVGAVVDAM